MKPLPENPQVQVRKFLVKRRFLVNTTFTFHVRVGNGDGRLMAGQKGWVLFVCKHYYERKKIFGQTMKNVFRLKMKARR